MKSSIPLHEVVKKATFSPSVLKMTDCKPVLHMAVKKPLSFSRVWETASNFYALLYFLCICIYCCFLFVLQHVWQSEAGVGE